MKVANITPVPDKDERTDKSNYRLISVLPNLSKVFEKCVYNQLLVFLIRFFLNISVDLEKVLVSSTVLQNH